MRCRGRGQKKNFLGDTVPRAKFEETFAFVGVGQCGHRGSRARARFRSLRIGDTHLGILPGISALHSSCHWPSAERPEISALATRAVPREGRTVPATERLPGAVVEAGATRAAEERARVAVAIVLDE